MSQGRVLVDMDGVLTGMHQAILDHHNLPEPDAWPDTSNSIIDFFGMDYAQIWEGIGEDWWAGLPKTDDADQIISIILKHTQNVFLVTKPVLTAGASGKIQWIRKHFPAFEKSFFLTPCREEMADKWTILVDDQSENVDLFNHRGGHGILLGRPWNRKLKSNPNEFVEEFREKWYCIGRNFVRK